MTLSELRYLVAVADRKHFGRAAEACHVSQPTLSTQIKKLEMYLGVTIFERANKSVQITPMGERVLERARRVLAEAEGIVTLARSGTRPLTGPFRLGVIPTLSPYFLPWLLPALQADHPELELAVVEDLTAALLDRVESHDLDAACIALPAGRSGFEAASLFVEPFLVACPAEHPLARAEAISLKELLRERVLLLTEGHCLREQAMEICGADAAKGANFRAASLETLRQMVAAGYGFTLLPAMAASDTTSTGGKAVARPLAATQSRTIGLAYRASYPRPEDMTLFAACVARTIPPSVMPARGDRPFPGPGAHPRHGRRDDPGNASWKAGPAAAAR